MTVLAKDIEAIGHALEEYPESVKLEGATVLLTGAGGFLGRYMVRVIDYLNHRRFASKATKLLALDTQQKNQVPRSALLLPEHVDFIAHDLNLDVAWIGRRIDFAIHAAGIASPHWYQKKPLATFDVATQGSRHILDIARRWGARYLFTSTSELYQTPPATAVPTPESYVGAIPLDGPRSCYDISKAAGETLAHIYRQEYGQDVGIVRIFNSYGPGLRQDDHRIMAKLGTAVAGGAPVKIYAKPGDKLPTRTYCYAANTVLGIFLALLKGAPGEVYNIGADEPEISTLQLCQRAKELGFDTPYEIQPAPAVYATEPMRRCPDISKAKSELGYSLIVPFEEGLTRFLGWAKENYTP